MVKLEITATNAKDDSHSDFEVWINDHPGLAEPEPQLFLRISNPPKEVGQTAKQIEIKMTYEDTRRLAAFLRFVLELGPISYRTENPRAVPSRLDCLRARDE